MAHLPPLPEPGELATVADLQTEWQRIHRGRNRRQLTPEEYTNLMYGLQSGLAITRARDELKQMREELAQRDRIAEALEQQHRIGLTTNGHNAAIDYLPAGDASDVEVAQ